MDIKGCSPEDCVCYVPCISAKKIDYPPCARNAMESQTTAVQQLKAEILALRKDGVVADDMYWVGWNMALERAAGMLKLSAV